MNGSAASGQKIPSHPELLEQLAHTPLANIELLQKQSIEQYKFHQSYAASLGRVIKHRKRAK